MNGIEVQDALRSLSNNRGVITVLSVVLGAGLFSWLAWLRDQRATRREQALNFANDIADLLNEAFAAVFAAVRRQDTSLVDRIVEAVDILFTKRLGVKVKGEVYFRSTLFASEYEAVLWRLDACRQVAQGKVDQDVASSGTDPLSFRFNSDEVRWIKSWPSNLKSPWNELEGALELTWRRSVRLLKEAMASGLKLRALKRLPAEEPLPAVPPSTRAVPTESNDDEPI